MICSNAEIFLTFIIGLAKDFN